MRRVGTSNEENRRVWIEQTLKELPEGNRLLDAGAGEQQYKKYCDHLHYVSQDFAEYEPEELDQGLQMDRWDYGQLDHVCDITSIPEPDSSFDAILCSEVFEHLPNPLAAVDEFSRLLKPGGSLLLTAPFVSLTHFAPYHFATGFNRFFYEHNLTSRGFCVEKIAANGNYFELVAQELRRCSSVAENYTNRRPNRIEKWSLKMLLGMLERFSKAGQQSSELGCYGLHVMARRLPKVCQEEAA